MHKFIRYYFQLNLRTQLLILMVAMMSISLGTFAYHQQVSEKNLLSFFQEEIDHLTKAIQIIVEQITTLESINRVPMLSEYIKGYWGMKPSLTMEEKLGRHLNRLKQGEIIDISLLSNEQEVVLSSNPELVGEKINVGKNRPPTRMNARFSDKTLSQTRQSTPSPMTFSNHTNPNSYRNTPR